MAEVFEHRLGWTVELNGRMAIGEYVGDECPVDAAIRAHMIDRDHPVRIETADGVVVELKFLSFGDFHQEGDPEKAEATGKAVRQLKRGWEHQRQSITADW